MNNARFWVAVGAVVVIAAGLFFFWAKPLKAPEAAEVVQPQAQTNTKTPASFDGKNATFSIDRERVSLVRGVTQEPAAPGSASMVTTRYFGNEAVGDLNGDGLSDTAFLVTRDGGGSGLFYYTVVALQTANGYRTTNAFLIGDRIAPQSTEIHSDSKELHVNYVERKPGEPMTAQPSVGAVLLLKVTPDGVLEGLMK